MNKISKLAIAAAGCIILGVLLISISWGMNGRKITNYNASNIKYEEMKYTCKSDVDDIYISETSNRVEVVSSNVSKVTINYFYSNNKLEYDISEANGKIEFTRKSINSINVGMNFTDVRVLVEVPKNYKGKLKTVTSSGNIKIDNITAMDFEAKASSGSIKIDGVVADAFKVTTTSGSILITDSVSEKAMNVEASSGGIKLENVVADSVKTVSSSGSAKLTNVMTKECNCKASSGSIRFEKLAAPSITMTCSSGSIHGDVEGAEDEYSVITHTASGSCNLKDKLGKDKSLNAETSSGSIHISFNK